MRLVIADLHLLNEANDRYQKSFQTIQTALDLFNLKSEITAVDFIGDVLDCEYVTYKRISYFSYIIDLISDIFSENIRILIGNHDKYFKNDQHDDNILRHLKFTGEIIDAPTIIDRILYIPHYYNEENFPATLLNENDFDIIIGHLGIEFSEDVKELTVENVRHHFKRVPIISGHIHNMNLDFNRNNFLLGSLKSESYKEQTPWYSVCIIDDNNIPKFITFPHYKSHPILDVYNEDDLRKDLLQLFKEIHECNTNYYLYDVNGNVLDKQPIDKYITSFLNIKFRVFDKNIKKKNIDLIIDYCKREIDDPIFMSINIKTVYHIESGDIGISTGDDDRFIKIDKKEVSTQKMIIFQFIDNIKNGSKLAGLTSNKKFTKIIDSIDESEIERFSEFLVSTKKEKDFSELIAKIA